MPASAEAGPQDFRTVTIVRADDGSVGLRFLRPHDAAAGPFEITGLVPNSPAEKSGAVRKGDLLYEVDGRDVSTLDDASVAKLFRGTPSSPFQLRVRSQGAAVVHAGWPSAPAMSEGDVEAAIAWAGRTGRLPAQYIPDFEALLRMLKPVSLHPSQISEGVVIGQGANGSVLRAEMQGVAVAVKRVNPTARKPLPQLIHEMLLELSTTLEVSRGQHPHIVTFLGAAVKFPAAKEAHSEWSMGLVFELCDPYDLYHLLHNHKIKLNMHQKLWLVRESAAGLAHIHSLGIIHRDFGSRNILIKDQHAKITDFGIARKLPAGHMQYQPSSICGTLQWMAPEQISGKMLSRQSDVFALGTVLWEILTEAVPFSDVQDPLKPDMPAMCSALNVRDMSAGGWPFGTPLPAHGSNRISVTLKLPWESCLEGLPAAVRRDLTRLFPLLHHHLPAFRPTADEAEDVLKHLEAGMDQGSPNNWFKSMWKSDSPAEEILMGLEERAAMGDRVARFYEKHDMNQLHTLEDAGRWDSIFQDSRAWETEMMRSYNATTRLTTSSVSKLIARRRRAAAECSTVVRVWSSTEGVSMPAVQSRGVLIQLLRGVTGVASWLVESVYNNLGLLKFSWVGRGQRLSDSGISPGADSNGQGLPVRSLPCTSPTKDLSLDNARSDVRSENGYLNA